MFDREIARMITELETPAAATPVTDTKACRMCGEALPLEAFYRQSRSRDGRRGECKACYRSMPSVKAQTARVKAKRAAAGAGT